MADETLGDFLESAIVTVYGLAKLFSLIAFLAAMWYVATHLPQLISNKSVTLNFFKGLANSLTFGIVGG